MKETRFIAQNKEKWQESERLLKESTKDPEKISTLFTQVVDDLSYSRTYYPNRSVRVYLNKIAREYFSILSRYQKEKRNVFMNFWLEELPQIMIFARKPMLVSLFVFILALAIGVFSAAQDPQFTQSILGDSYVEMTKENIASGDPMAVYKKSNQVDMFLGITLNNLMVAFRTFVFGIFFSVGTLGILLYNGIMVGCFQYFFIERGLFVESALTIWLHGTLEISSIILAGGAGLVLGSGLLFPGTYTRLQAFQLSAMRSLKIMLGITPIFVIAGLIESFLTRYTEVPDLLRLFLILLSALFIIGYFIVYPWLKSRSGFTHPLEEEKIAVDNHETLLYDRIKSNAEILKDSFLFYKLKAGRIIPWVLTISALMALAQVLMSDLAVDAQFYGEWWQYILNNLYYALETNDYVAVLMASVASSLICYRTFMLFKAEKEQAKMAFKWNWFAAILTISLSLYMVLFWLEGFGSLLLIFSFLFIMLFGYVLFVPRDTVSFWNLYNQTAGARTGQVFGLQFILLLLSFSFLLILSAPLIYMYSSILQWNFTEDDVWTQGVVRFFELFIKLVSFYLILPIFTISASFLFHSLREVGTAQALKKDIENTDFTHA
jgi:uncharacterized membrane protein SpoIIM required for sporulation